MKKDEKMGEISVFSQVRKHSALEFGLGMCAEIRM